jgi:hypothetical protein
MYIMYKIKVRSVTGHEHPDGEYRYSCILSLTLTLDWGGSLTRRPGLFTVSERDSAPIVQKARWDPRPVWKGAEILASTRIRSRTFQPIASRYTENAIPTHHIYFHLYTGIYLFKMAYLTSQGTKSFTTKRNPLMLFSGIIDTECHICMKYTSHVAT